MTCHGKKTGQLEECPTCKVLGSCVTSWNKNHEPEDKIRYMDLVAEEMRR